MQIMEATSVVFWGNLHSWQKMFTTAGRDGRDKFQLWLNCSQIRVYYDTVRLIRSLHVATSPNHLTKQRQGSDD